MNRVRLFILVNAAFVLCLFVGMGLHGPQTHPLYLIALFALCSSPILNFRQVNDEYFLLHLFSAWYFLWFGVLDFAAQVMGGDGVTTASEGVIDKAEGVILFGGVLFQVFYRLLARGATAKEASTAREWPELTLTVVGIPLWVVSTWLVWRFSLYIVKDTTSDAIRMGLGSLGGLETDMYMLANYFQPFSIMLLAYGRFRYGRAYLTPVVLGALAVQFILGFVADSKGQALSGVVIVMIAKFLVDHRIPKLWLVGALAFVLVSFPLLQANRAVRHSTEQSRASAAENLGKAFTDALQIKDKVARGPNRVQTIFERISMKDGFEVIINKVGDTVDYRHGDTLIALPTAFIPRIIWPDKPMIQVGKLVARKFHPEASDEVNLSPTHLAELYWNFGWTGVAVGMPIIAALFGWIGAKCNLSRGVTLTRVLVLLVTTQIVVQGFEASIAIQYSVWLRMLAGIGILHWLFARRAKAQTAFNPPQAVARESMPAVAPELGLINVLQPRYQNLLR
ncbi:MAG TPA: hypothetical protein VGM84_00870 [Steroidobacteraceae bacterium]|jgi:hypothetical protein